MERTNFRTVDLSRLDVPYPVIVADVSFISLCAIAAKLEEAAANGADLIMLVKPHSRRAKATWATAG